jgi:hypothetical protein
MNDVGSVAAWNCALSFAITGKRFDDLGLQAAPDLDLVAGVVAAAIPGGTEGIRAHVASRRTAGRPWPYPLPDDLAAGIAPAQWSAALHALRQRLGIDPQVQVVRRPPPPDRDDLRLVHQLPPHHGPL